MRFLNIPLFVLCLGLTLGIVLQYHYAFSPLVIVVSVVLISIFLIYSYLYNKNRVNTSFLFVSASILMSCSLGLLLVYSNSSIQSNSHYTQFVQTEDLDYSEPVVLTFTIRKQLKPTTKYRRYYANVKQIDTIVCQGIVLLLLPKKPSGSLDFTKTYQISGHVYPITSPRNPHDFNYKQYLSNQKVRMQFKATTSSGREVAGSHHFRPLIQLRQHLLTVVDHIQLPTDVQQFTQSLLLGQRQSLDPRVYQNFVDTGIIHILAVSGLHIGIIYTIFQWLFGFFDRKFSSKLRIAFVLIGIWSFAFLTGASASVLRASILFSFIAINSVRLQKQNSFNGLFASYLVLLCISPLLLFDVGFQLSYLAVASILMFYPKISRLYRPRFLVDKVIWNTLIVSAIAQLGLLPVSLFYFHQFPGLFLISNLLVLLVLPFVMYLGIVIVLLATLSVFWTPLIQVYVQLVRYILWTAAYFSKFTQFTIKDIYWPKEYLVFGLSIWIGISIFLYTSQNYRRMQIGLVIIAFLLLGKSIVEYNSKTKDELLLLHNWKDTVLLHRYGQRLEWLSTSLDTEPPSALYQYKNYEKTPSPEHILLKNAYCVYDKSVYIVTNSFIPTLSKHTDYVVLSKNPKINLNRLIDSLKPIQIIADGSNAKYMLTKWEETCAKRKIPWHRTDTMGFYKF